MDDNNLTALKPGEHRLPCPACASGPRDRTFGVTVGHDGAAVGHCFRCEYVETHRPDRPPSQRPGKAINRPLMPLKRQTLSEQGLELFSASIGLRGTVGEQYLLARGCVIPPDDGDLRFHPGLKHPSGYIGPALVALVTHAETCVPMTLHQTWIQADKKANVDLPRLLLRGHAKKGGVIRLWPDEAVTLGLALGEGVESSLSLAHSYAPVWSCLDAGNLGAFPVLAGVETLIVGADNDQVGIKAAKACADRWAAAGTDVRLVAPAAARSDWNDAEAA